MTEEELRLGGSVEGWRRWGPYLSERAWGTVREDYSPDGSAWTSFPHDHARSRAYRWNEDGLAGISDDHQHVCFAFALWNGKDPILKERLFGLNGAEGNHGEDVKELYYYLDSTPTHSYMKTLYKYPHAEFPYERLVQENASRGRQQGEFEILDTGVFDEERYFDVFVEYAKAEPDDILIRVRIANRGPETASLHLLPTIWLRNVWQWHGIQEHAEMGRFEQGIRVNGPHLGDLWLYCEGEPEIWYTENETNSERVWGAPSPTPFVKDAFHRRLINGEVEATNGEGYGTKAAAVYLLEVPSNETREVRLRLTNREIEDGAFGSRFDDIFDKRLDEANQFYATVIPSELSDDAKNVMRQALAGMLWSKQYYHFDVEQWLTGDRAEPTPPASRMQGRNAQWKHMYAADVISMPDKWEYPWFASWDLAFHCIPLALVDPQFAKDQLILLLREWYMHPNGQLPAYEWSFDDANPPVHAWSALRVFRIDKRRKGKGDYEFLERVFHKLLLNFTWWVNRKDAEGRHLFQGGFLGLDNIGIFDRSAPLPMGGHLDQADGTAWMGFYCLNLMAMALELALVKPAYEDVATKFLEHFAYIGKAMTSIGGDMTMWDDQDGFFYDVLCLPDGCHQDLKVRSMVGLIPLFAVDTLEPEVMRKLHGFRARMEWFVRHRPDLMEHLACMTETRRGERRLLAIVDPERLKTVLKRLLDSTEFLSDFGIRAVSRVHKDNPYVFRMDGHEWEVNYEPGESTTTLFGGNSNWRGPIWFPVNYLIIESLQKFDYYLGDKFKVECPTGSGNMMDLYEVASELSKRLNRIFLRGADGRRPVHGEEDRYRSEPNWRDLVLFNEYFHGDTGRGLGASHQTGWTGIVAKLLQQSGE